MDAWDQLGRRPQDLQVDWTARVGTYPDLLEDWWATQKADYPEGPRSVIVADYDSLELKQKLLSDTLTQHFGQILEGNDITLEDCITALTNYRQQYSYRDNN
jgi:hypothetical protein